MADITNFADKIQRIELVEKKASIDGSNVRRRVLEIEFSINGKELLAELKVDKSTIKLIEVGAELGDVVG